MALFPSRIGGLPVPSISDRDAREHGLRWLGHVLAGRIGAGDFGADEAARGVLAAERVFYGREVTQVSRRGGAR